MPPRPEPIYAWIGAAIASARRRRRLSQVGLAARIQMTRAAVSNMEQGGQRIMLHVLLAVAEILDVPAAELIRNARARARRSGVSPDRMLRRGDDAPAPPRAPVGRPRGRRSSR